MVRINVGVLGQEYKRKTGLRSVSVMVKVCCMAWATKENGKSKRNGNGHDVLPRANENM